MKKALLVLAFASLGFLPLSGKSQPSGQDNVVPPQSPPPVSSGGSVGGGFGAMGGMGMGMASGGYATSVGTNVEDLATRVFVLRYMPVNEMEEIISRLYGQRNTPFGFGGETNFTVASDARTNSLIIVMPEKDFPKVEELIRELDVARSGEEDESEVVQNVAYRIFAVETVSDQSRWIQFEIVMNCSEDFNTERLFETAKSSGIELRDVARIGREPEAKQYVLRVSGRALSEDAALNLTAGHQLQTINISGDETSTAASTQYDIPLPSQLEPVISKLLGSNHKIVGYWFGNSAAPGSLTAPIGAWNLDMNTDLTHESELVINVAVSERQQANSGVQWNASSGAWNTNNNYGTSSRSSSQSSPDGLFFDSSSGSISVQPSRGPQPQPEPQNTRGRFGRGGRTITTSPSPDNRWFSYYPNGGSNTILSNTVRGKLGKPVIIGYSRNAGGSSIIGALVIVPETDFSGIANEGVSN